MNASIGEFAEHLFYVRLRDGNPQTGVGLHFCETLANFTFLGVSQGGWLLDFVAVFIEPAGERPPFGQRQRQHLGFDLFHAHG